MLGKSVIVAAGVSYGLLDLEGLNTLQGAGVYYSATNIEARLCRSSPAHVVGGGNSAGQAAMFLSQTAEEVSLVVRGPDLRKMSSYLSERVLANRRVRIRYNTLRGVVSLHGILTTPMAAQPKTVVCKILVLHGNADPVVSLESVIAFREEMRLAQANWQINIYGEAKHSFTGEGRLA